MADNEMQVRLEVEVDKAALARVKTAMQSIDGMTRAAIKGSSDIADAQKAARQSVLKLGDAFSDAEGQASQSIDGMIQAIKDFRDAADDALEQPGTTKPEKGQPETTNVASAIKSAGEAISKPLSGSPIGEGITAISEIPEIIETLSMLKQAFAGLPSAIGGAVSALGPLGLAVGAALAVVGVAIANFAAESQKRAQELSQVVEAIRRVGQQVAEGMTASEAEGRFAELNRKRQAEADLLAELEQQYAANINSAGLLAPVLKAASYEEEALIEQINKSKDAVKEMEAESQQLQKALQSAALAANEAANVLRAELDAQQNVISDIVNGMTSVEAQGLIERAQLNAEYQQAEIARLQALLETISTTDPKFQVVSDAIAKASDNLNAARGTIEAYSQALSQGKFAASDAKEAAKEAAKAQEEAAKEQEKAAQEAAKAQEEAARKAEQAADMYRNAERKMQDGLESAERGYRESLSNIAKKARDNAVDMAKALSRDMVDMQQKAELARQDKLTEFNRRDIERTINHQRNLDKIRRDANRSIEDAVRNQDALALAKAVEAGKEQLADEELKNQQAIEDARRSNQQVLDDLAENLRRQRAERLVDYQRAQADAREAQAREIRDAREARVKALQMVREAYQKELALLQEKFAAELGLYQQLARAASGAGAPSGPSPVAQPQPRGGGGVNINVNGAINPGAVAGSVVQQMRRVGLI